MTGITVIKVIMDTMVNTVINTIMITIDLLVFQGHHKHDRYHGNHRITAITDITVTEANRDITYSYTEGHQQC
jgi:hypothetical protein